MRLHKGSTTPVRYVPHTYGRSKDEAIEARARRAVQTAENLQLETTGEKSILGQADVSVGADEVRASPQQIYFHPLAEIFPLAEGPEFDELVSDVAKHGQLEAIVLFESKILDGRNRHRTCVAAGVAPRFEPYQGDDPLGLVISRNVRRRHLDQSQRALIAAKLETMGHGGNRKAGQDANLRVDRSAAAKMLNVSERSVASAAKVLDTGSGELVRAVEQAKIKVSAAARAADLSANLQRQVADSALAGDAKAARAIIAQDLRARPGAEPLTLRAAKTIIASLRETLEEAEADFVSLRDPLPAADAAKASELAALVVADEVVANDELTALAHRYHWRLRDLIAEGCRLSALTHLSPAVTRIDESTSDGR
jgi:hypothetical protein